MAPLPPPRTRLVVTLLIAFHFGSLIVAWGANTAPSFLQGELQSWLAPWHVSTGQDYIMLPIDLAHAEAMESPVWLQFRQRDESDWQTVAVPGVQHGEQTILTDVLPTDYSGKSSRWANIARLLAWIAIEQPDSEVLPAFMQQAVTHLHHNRGTSLSSIAQVRLFQPHALNFDEALIAERGQASLIDEQLNGRTLYAAHVLEASSGEIQLVPVEDIQRTAAPAPSNNAGLESPTSQSPTSQSPTSQNTTSQTEVQP